MDIPAPYLHGTHACRVYEQAVLKILKKQGIAGENMGLARNASNGCDPCAGYGRYCQDTGAVVSCDYCDDRIYDPRKTRSEDSPTFKVSY